MKTRLSVAGAFLCMLVVIFGSGAEADPFFPIEGFVEANSVRLEYLDWGGKGLPLILLHGLGGSARIFDDAAPILAKRFHVIAYTRRGSPGSDLTGPYDSETLTRDLRGLMDALGIGKAILAGYSAGGDEATLMAAESPDRVARLVYLDSAYDWTDPDFVALDKHLPVGFTSPPLSTMQSIQAYLGYQRREMFPSVSDFRLIEPELRQRIVIREDGTLHDRVPPAVTKALFTAIWSNKSRTYEKVKCPTLAIYADHLYDLDTPDARLRTLLLTFEAQYWKPFQTKSILRVERELKGVEIVRLPGAHPSFILTHRDAVIATMLNFLAKPETSHATRKEQ